MFSDALKTEIKGLIDIYPSKRAALIMAFHAVQREHSYISTEDFVELGKIFDEHPAEVQSTASFYTMFHTDPVGANIIEVCTNASCMLRGAEDIAEHLKEKLGIDFGETTDDGLFTLLEVECLAACGEAPVIAVNGAYKGPVTVDDVVKLIEECRRGNGKLNERRE